MKDEFAAQVAAQGNNDEIRLILEQVCEVTRMGFAAVARVTEERWIACQVLDRIEFGLDPGDELEIKKTICEECPAGSGWTRRSVRGSAVGDGGTASGIRIGKGQSNRLALRRISMGI